MAEQNLRSIILLIFLVLPICASAQVQLTGTVTEILDSQTVTITDLRGNAWAVRLRAIETPDEGQVLSDVVREHVTNLLLSKQVTFRFSSMGEGEFVAMVTIDGRDASQQLIRDGAAWLYTEELGGASAEDLDTYRALETQAKNEGRGIWAESGLIRPSEVRTAAHKVGDPLADAATAKIAFLAFGSAIEGVFGNESYFSETTDCSGRVVGVADGDTVTILTGSNRNIKVRLAGIDAPEKSQSCGMKAKQHLSGLVFGKYVSCSSTQRDRYGRVIGKLSLSGVDINRQMIVDGHAYHYKAYQGEQTTTVQPHTRRSPKH